MVHSRSHRLNSPSRGRLRAFKENTPLQAIIFALSTVVFLVYGFLMSYQLSAILYAVDSNTKLIKTDLALEDVADFTVSDNSVTINLFNGDTVHRRDVEFAFYENTGKNVVYYSADSNTLLKELPDNYATTFLLGNNFFVVLAAVFVSVIFLFVIRKRGWTVYSRRVARVLGVAVFIGLFFVGGCFYLVL